MQQLDAVTLRAIARELETLLGNAKVSKVQHTSAHEFLITFWGGANRPEHQNLLFIQLNPEAPFCALTDTKRRQDTALHSFEKPTALCMLLRKQLHGASLQGVRTLPGERVLDLVFENYNELGNKVRLVLSVELMGKHTNMLLYDEVQGVLLAVAHGVSEVMSQYRELAAGLPYAPPPKPPGKQLLATMTEADFLNFLAQKPSEDSLSRFLNTNLAGFGQRMLEDSLALSAEPKALYRCLTALEAGEDLHPAISANGERFTLLPQANAEQWKPMPNVNVMVGDYFTAHWRKMRVHRQRQQLRHILERHRKRLQQREKELVPGAADEIQTFQAIGDRLLAAVSSREIPEHPIAHKRTVELMHYDTGEPWPIEIDPSCSWVENAQTYYRRAKKAKARREIYEQISAILHAEREYIDTLKQLVDQAETVAELTALEADIAQVGLVRIDPNAADEAATYNGKTQSKNAGKAQGKTQAKKKPSKNKPDKQKAGGISGVASFVSSDGLEILLGKSGQGNDAIVGKLSRTDDWWLHVHQMPGSHVLIRAGKGDVPDQTLLEAAMLAVYYSSARDSLNVPVVYTQSKFVRKIPQSYPGHVNYRQERTVFITPENALIGRLLQTAKTPEG
jgi:predicted ribosome quality control (RQC) complex YloA/Tae2 family protein